MSEFDPIEQAMRLELISAQQGQMLRDELLMFPGTNPSMMMLRRGFITPEQHQRLLRLAAGEEDEDEMDTSFVVPSAARPAAPTPAPVQPSPRVDQPPTNSYVTPSPVSTSVAPPATDTNGEGAWSQGPEVTVGHVHSTGAGIDDYLAYARELRASDLHIAPGMPPFVRIYGEIHTMDEEPLTPERSKELGFAAIPPDLRGLTEADQQLDFSYEVAGLGIHRCNVYKQRLGWEGAFRIVSQTIPSLDELGCTPVAKRLTEFGQGLILVTGGTGSGKTTTVASMLNYINQHRKDHIVTVEDPIEYVIRPVQCQVTQRQIGKHTESYGSALRAALRQDPDVIMVGELRDLETTSIAISASETGHLVLGTMHTSSALRTVARMMDIFPPAQRAQVCVMVAESIRGILAQQLIPHITGQKLVLAQEVLVFTTGVAQIIKEGKTHQLSTQIQSGKKLGMQTMDDALMQLVQQRQISGAEAYNRAENKAVFESVKAGR